MGYESVSDGDYYLEQSCLICRQGKYSTSNTSTSCSSCPGGQITSQEGSTSASQCLAGKKLSKLNILRMCDTSNLYG